MKKFLLTAIFILAAASISLSAASIRVTSSSNGATAGLETYVNGLTDLDYIGDNTDFATAMGDATQFATTTASLNSFQNYNLFAVSVGWGVGVVNPTVIADSDLQDKLEQDGDIKAGAASTALLNVGVNLGLFVDNLYGNVAIGGIPETEIADGLKMSQFVIGLGVNYRLIDSIGLGGLAKWRGISLGSGLYYINSKSSYNYKYGNITDGTATINPDIDFKSDISLVKIPLEAVTSFQALWIMNFGLGAGADLVFGKSNFSMAGKSDITLNAGGSKIGEAEIIDGDTEANPTLFKFKLLASVGFNFGPVKIDVPAAYYPGDGYFVGVTTGFIF